MRWVLAVAAAAVVAGCGSSGGDPDPGSTGSVPLAQICPQVHVAIDSLVVSSPAAQQQFVTELERISEAGTAESRAALAPLLEAGRVLAAAGTGQDYFGALEQIHPAQVAVDGKCVAAGSPILHDGAH